MSVSLAPPVRFKAFYPGSGNPLAGGRLWTLQPGTVGYGYLKATYTDSAGQTVNSNPVILDGSGEADVWLSGYTKLVLQDGSGNVIWSKDNVSSSAAAGSGTGQWVPQSGLVFTYVNATQFSTPGDQTGLFQTRMRVQAIVSAGTIYGTVTAAASSGSPLVTTVTVSWDSGVLDQGLSAIATGILTPLQSALPEFIGAGTGAVARTIFAKLSDTVSVKDFGATGLGVSDDSAAINAAIASLTRGGTVFVPNGTYLLTSQVLAPYSAGIALIRIVGESRAACFKAGAANIALIRFSDSYGGVENLTLNGNGQTGITGLRVAPQDEAQTSSAVYQSYNKFDNIEVTDCTEGIILVCGPYVSSTGASGAYYNTFSTIHILDCVRGVWLKSAVNASSSPPNANRFFNVRIGSTSDAANTGFQIDSGASNQFFGCATEGIAYGTSPSTTPTAVKIANLDAWSNSNNDNSFFGCGWENNTCDIDNANPYTQIYAGTPFASKTTGSAQPGVSIGSDPSNMPLILPGLMHGEGLSGYPSGIIGITKEIADWDGTKQYNWLPYALSTSNVTNVTALTSSRSSFSKMNGMVAWHFAFAFQASASGGRIEVVPPVAVPSFYNSLSGFDPYLGLWVNNGYGFTPTYGGFDSATGNLYVAAPSDHGGWLTSGSSNQVFVMVHYHQ